MASISNTGKTITIAFSHEEKEALEARGGDDWKWQIASFDIAEGGIGTFTFRADMHEGRKLGPMSGGAPDRWMLVIPSAQMKMVPYFNRVKVDVDFSGDDPKMSKVVLPRELPPLSDAKMAKLGSPPKPKVTAKKVATPPAPAPSQAVAVIPQPQQRDGSNLTLLIEGRSFRYEVPIEDRLRIMADLARFAVVKA